MELLEQPLKEIVDKLVEEKLKDKDENNSPFMNKAQCCKHLGICNNTLDKWIKELNLPVLKDGRSYTFHKQEINKWYKETILHKK